MKTEYDDKFIEYEKAIEIINNSTEEKLKKYPEIFDEEIKEYLTRFLKNGALCNKYDVSLRYYESYGILRNESSDEVDLADELLKKEAYELTEDEIEQLEELYYKFKNETEITPSDGDKYFITLPVWYDLDDDEYLYDFFRDDFPYKHALVEKEDIEKFLNDVEEEIDNYNNNYLVYKQFNADYAEKIEKKLEEVEDLELEQENKNNNRYTV